MAVVLLKHWSVFPLWHISYKKRKVAAVLMKSSRETIS